jgi:hypothetical protein
VDAVTGVVDTLRGLPPALAAPGGAAALAVERCVRAGAGRDEVTDDVLDIVAAFFEAAWPALGPEGQAPWLRAAREALGDLADQLDEAELDGLVEEHARGLLRASLPALSATRLAQALLSCPP